MKCIADAASSFCFRPVYMRVFVCICMIVFRVWVRDKRVQEKKFKRAEFRMNF